jgi:hypothetical protein
VRLKEIDMAAWSLEERALSTNQHGRRATRCDHENRTPQCIASTSTYASDLRSMNVLLLSKAQKTGFAVLTA